MAADTMQIPAEFRPQRYYLVVGIICTAGFAAFGLGSTVAALWNIDGSFRRPLLAACVFGCFWSFWILLGAWITLAAVRERLILERGAVTAKGVFRTRSICIAEIESIQWSRFPRGGSIVVRGFAHKIKVYLENFLPEERERIIAHFRQAISPDLHDGWDRFEEFRKRLYTPPSRRRTAAVVAAHLGCAGIFIACEIAGRGRGHLLVLGMANLVSAVWYLWHIRRRRLSSQANNT